MYMFSSSSQGLALIQLSLLLQPWLAQASPLLSLRQSDAECGPNANGAKCALGLCCSAAGYCGGDDAHCNSGSCQLNYGTCTIPQAPTCDGTAASGGRKVAYYQALAANQRDCGKMTAKDIPADGLSHLIYAFASIDPSSFKVVPADPADVPLYTEFTGIQTDSLQTWIAVGGGSFSNDGPTHTTWSDMTSTSDNRAKFISSLKSFMEQYKFQGVDLDWESPVEAARGGNVADTANLVSLVKEMRASFGDSYGISAAVPPFYGDLKGFDLAEMDSSMTFWNLMMYDLTSETNPTLASQTDMTNIEQRMIPYWASGADTSKFNLGLAYYGRGFTLSDTGCQAIGCGASGPSTAESCSNTPGFLFNFEIQDLISAGATPQLNETAMVKELVYNGNQWVSYDDDDSIKLKLDWADQHCFGGSMIWTIDRISSA